MIKNWRDTSTWNHRIQNQLLKTQRKISSSISKHVPFISSFCSVFYETSEAITDTGYTYTTHHWKPNIPTDRYLLLIPDWGKLGSCFLEDTAIITGQEIAESGWNVISIDFCGRGNSWGNEDWGGYEHQEQVSQQIQSFPSTSKIVVLAFGAGLNTAIRGIDLSGRTIETLIDVEGIPNKEILFRLPTKPKESIKSVDYWSIRSCDRILSTLSYPYYRIQGEIDQNIPDDLRHARLVIRNVNKDVFRLYGHPKGIRPDRPRWIKHGKMGLREALLHVISMLEK